MPDTAPIGPHAGLMDAVYRRQRHIYDATRKYYLLGRDRLIGELTPPKGGSVLEIGCGTGRNLLLAARRWPGARLFGLDISAQMLASARSKLASAGVPVRLAQADATDFSPVMLFDEPGFERVFISYSLSMIPDWEKAIEAALGAIKPGGSLHVADFGMQDGLPGWFRRLLRAWLAKFHVTPRASLEAALREAARRHCGELAFSTPYRGYAALAVIRLPAAKHPFSPPS